MFLPLAGIVLLAWAALWWLQQSAFASLLHPRLPLLSPLGAHAQHHGDHPFPLWLSGSAFVGSWLLMTIAMMLPGTLPLMNAFRRMVRSHGMPSLPVLLSTGYLLAWLAVGIAAWLLMAGLNQLAGEVGPVPTGLWSGTLFLLAGGFQFSRLKYACLEQCRSALGFLAARWQGRQKRRDAFRIGWDHGLFCVGCCWALMLLMFALGTHSLSWMLLLALLMTAEKTLSWGRRIVRPVGAFLILSGLSIIAVGLY